MLITNHRVERTLFLLWFTTSFTHHSWMMMEGIGVYIFHHLFLLRAVGSEGSTMCTISRLLLLLPWSCGVITMAHVIISSSSPFT